MNADTIFGGILVAICAAFLIAWGAYLLAAYLTRRDAETYRRGYLHGRKAERRKAGLEANVVAFDRAGVRR